MILRWKNGKYIVPLQSRICSSEFLDKKSAILFLSDCCLAKFGHVPLFRSDSELDLEPQRKMQKQVAIALADAEFCKQEQATFTPDMLNIAAESALYLYEQLDLKLRKRLVYDRPYILDTLARSKWLLTKCCYHSLQGHPLKRA